MQLAPARNIIQHDNCKNHNRSTKSMGPEIAMECFNAGQSKDTTTESHIKYNTIQYNTSKRADQNHANKTLGSRRYALQSSVKGLFPAVIYYNTTTLLREQIKIMPIKLWEVGVMLSKAPSRDYSLLLSVISRT